MPNGPVPRFTFELPAEVQEDKALQSAFSGARDRLDVGTPLLTVLRDAIADDAHTLVRALVKHGDDYLYARQADENTHHQFAEAVEALASVQAKAKAAQLSALDRIAGEA